jgi:hypothetical protein
MNNPVPLRVDTIKGLTPIGQAAALRALVPQYLSRAAEIRGVFENSHHGIVKTRIEGSDERVVLLALLTAVADDIGTVPDSKRVIELMTIHERVAAELGFEKTDVLVFLRNLDLVMKALSG